MGDFECPADTRGEEKLRAVVTGMLRVDCLLLRLQICRVGGGRSPFFSFTFQTFILLTCLANTAISSLTDSDEQTSPPATPGSRGVQVANSHFSKISAKRGKRGCLQENTTVTNNTMVSPKSGGREPTKSSRRGWRRGPLPDSVLSSSPAPAQVTARLPCLLGPPSWRS